MSILCIYYVHTVYIHTIHILYIYIYYIYTIYIYYIYYIYYINYPTAWKSAQRFHQFSCSWWCSSLWNHWYLPHVYIMVMSLGTSFPLGFMKLVLPQWEFKNACWNHPKNVTFFEGVQHAFFNSHWSKTVIFDKSQWKWGAKRHHHDINRSVEPSMKRAYRSTTEM